MPRAVTAVKALRDAGVNVAAGADNLQDPFNLVGRADPLETAGLMIMAAHVAAGGCARHGQRRGPARRWGWARATTTSAVRACSMREAIAFGPPDRVVVARTDRDLETERSHERD